MVQGRFVTTSLSLDEISVGPGALVNAILKATHALRVHPTQFSMHRHLKEIIKIASPLYTVAALSM